MAESDGQSDPRIDRLAEQVERQAERVRAVATKVNEMLAYLRDARTAPAPPAVKRPDLTGLGLRLNQLEAEIQRLNILGDEGRNRPVLLPSVLGADLRWAKAIATWFDGNEITIDPCNEGGVDNGLSNVTGYIVTDIDANPAGGGLQPVITEGDVLAYVPFGENKGVLVNVPWKLNGTHENPKVLSGSGVNADINTWDITNQGENDGVQYQAFRLYWSGVAGEPIYQFIRTPTFDSIGRLVAVSSEVRSEAFGTGPCAS